MYDSIPNCLASLIKIKDSNYDLAAQGSLHGFNSALTGRSAIPFSGFKTPQVASGRWSERVKIDSSVKRGEHEIKGERFAERGVYDVFDNYHDPYPSWSNSSTIPITRQEIELIFIDLMEIFGFQLDNTKNMFDFLLRLLDSRASRMDPNQALRSLHADYIGGPNSNFKKWYFAAKLDIDDTIGFVNVKKNGKPKSSHRKNQDPDEENVVLTLEESEKRWSQNMNSLSAHDSVIQISIYLLCWGEANNIRFMPECLCFIFKCCNDYYYGLEKIRADSPELPSPTNFLDHVITPLYEYYRDQSYEVVDGRYVNRDKDHASIIGYDDMNQFFWYRKGLEKIQLQGSKKLLVSYPPHERYIYLNSIKWSKCFYKTYKEKRTWGHVVLNFNRIWIIHFAAFWLYTALNSPTLYTQNYQQHLNNKPTVQATLTVMALNGSISTLINIIATILEFFFVPRKWPGAQPLTKRLLILIVILLIITAPSVYIFGFIPLKTQTTLGLALAITQFILSIFITIYFAIVPIGSLFGGTLKKKKGREFLSNLYFTRSFHKLRGKAALSSYGLWVSVFTAKFVESYFFLTLSLKDPVRELSVLQMHKCVGEVYFGDLFCRYQPKVLLLFMYLTDLVLFFLDTYLWYIICNTFHSVCRSLYNWCVNMDSMEKYFFKVT